MGGKGTLEPERKEEEEKSNTIEDHAEEALSRLAEAMEKEDDFSIPRNPIVTPPKDAMTAAGEHVRSLWTTFTAWKEGLNKSWMEQCEKAYQSELHELESKLSVNEQTHLGQLEFLCEQRKKRIAKCRKRLENIQRAKRGEPPLGDSAPKKGGKTRVWFVVLACVVTTLLLLVNQQAYYNEKIKVLKAENGRQLAKILEQQETLSQKEAMLGAQLDVLIEGYNSAMELYNALLEEHQKTLDSMEQQVSEFEEAANATEPARERWANLYQKLDGHNPEKKFVDEYVDLISVMYRDLCAQEGVTPVDKVLFYVATLLNGVEFRFHAEDSSDLVELFWECAIQTFIMLPIFGMSMLAVLCRPIYLLLTTAPSIVVSVMILYVAVQINEQRRASQGEEAGQQQQQE